MKKKIYENVQVTRDTHNTSFKLYFSGMIVAYNHGKYKLSNTIFNQYYTFF